MPKIDQLCELARIRTSECPLGYKQPESFPEKGETRYEFSEFVSPINKACIDRERAQVMGVLQDWSGADHLNRQGFVPIIQDIGYDPTVSTNVKLERLVKEVLKLEHRQIYITNAIPWVKAGAIGARVQWREARSIACPLLLRQFEIIKPDLVLVFGVNARRAVFQSDIPLDRVVFLRHPARIGYAKLFDEWRSKIIQHG